MWPLTTAHSLYLLIYPACIPRLNPREISQASKNFSEKSLTSWRHASLVLVCRKGRGSSFSKG